MAEFEVNGHTYQSGRLNAFQQMHVARRLLPVMGSLAPLMGLLKTREATSDAPREDADQGAATGAPPRAVLDTLLGPLTHAIAALSDPDCDYVVQTCLSVTKRRSGDRFAPVWNTGSKQLMFQDLDMMEMLRIAVEVLRDNIGGFFPAAASAALASAATT